MFQHPEVAGKVHSQVVAGEVRQLPGGLQQEEEVGAEAEA